MDAYLPNRNPAERPIVAIDLHPAAPGGVNGGIKVVADELVRELPVVAPDLDFIVLTNANSSPPLNLVEASGERQEKRTPSTTEVRRSKFAGPLKSRLISVGREVASCVLPQSYYWRVITQQKERRHGRFIQRFLDIKPDLVFCPFASQLLCGRGIPSVSLIADLQHQFFPSFFPRPERLSREHEFLRACRTADRLIAISGWTRQTILDAMPDLAPDKVDVIHIGLPDRSATADRKDDVARFSGLGLKREEYLLYPANFWSHKNHARALSAFAMFLRQHPESRLKLVLTGADTGCKSSLLQQIHQAGLADRIVFTGYCDNDLLKSLLDGCAALFFPSLFEGYGIPTLEAMAAGRPVLCSRLPSLVEIVGDCAITFEPTDIASIAAALSQFHRTGVENSGRISKGIMRAMAIGDSRRMAERYAATFREVLENRGRRGVLKSRAA